MLRVITISLLGLCGVRAVSVVSEVGGVVDLFKPKCQMTDAYPPKQSEAIGWYNVNLDLPAEERWTEVATDMKDDIVALFHELWNCQEKGSACFFARVFQQVSKLLKGKEQAIIERWPHDWGMELLGIANATGVPLNQLVTFNMGYELMGACTSVVAYNQKTDAMFHGRNLDFGLLLGFNFSDMHWQTTDLLRKVAFNANMQKGGRTLYSGTFYASFIGVLTAVRKGGLSISVNTRFDKNFDKYLLKWLEDPSDNGQFLTLTTRMAIEEHSQYSEALQFIKDTRMVSPGYVAIGGPNARQGAVVTIGPDATLCDEWNISSALPKDDSQKWYVLQTNYDHWQKAPFYDNRREPGKLCMEKVGSEDMDVATLFNVLHGKPNRNRLTTYTTLMQCSTGHLEAWRQHCDDKDCSPW